MRRLFSRKPKKSPKPPEKHIQPEVPTNTAAGPLGFQTEFNIAPKGERNRSYRDLDVDWTDSTVAPDEESGGGSRIVSHGKTSGDQELSAPETLAPGVVDVGDTDHGLRQLSERFRSLLPWLAFM